MPAGPFASAPAPRPDEVRRFLRLERSSPMQGARRVPIAALSAMTGVSRKQSLRDDGWRQRVRGLLRAADAADPQD
jgi:hypothetical protein